MTSIKTDKNHMPQWELGKKQMSIFEDDIEHYISIHAKGERSYNFTGGVGNIDNADNLQLFLHSLILGWTCKYGIC